MSEAKVVQAVANLIKSKASDKIEPTKEIPGSDKSQKGNKAFR